MKNIRFDLFPVSVHLIFRRENFVLMLRRHKTGFCDGMYSVPAGHVMSTETILQAAVRESQEEVGLEISPKDCTVTGVMFRRSTEARIDFFIDVAEWIGEPRNLEPDKCIDVAWFPKFKLPSNTIPYVRQALIKNNQLLWFEEYI